MHFAFWTIEMRPGLTYGKGLVQGGSIGSTLRKRIELARQPALKPLTADRPTFTVLVDRDIGKPGPSAVWKNSVEAAISRRISACERSPVSMGPASRPPSFQHDEWPAADRHAGGHLRRRHDCTDEPFAAMILCTVDPDKVDKRTRSKWSRVLRYATEYKPISEPLAAFIERKGGINKCAARFTRCVGRHSVMDQER